MVKRNLLLIIVLLLISSITENVQAQDIVTPSLVNDMEMDSIEIDSMEIDTICIDESELDSAALTNTSDWDAETDSCIQARYVIVTKNGKYGIYDNEKKEYVTDVDMDYLQYSYYFKPEEDLCFCYFYYERGIEYGRIGINMQNNKIITMSGLNPSFAQLDNCTTIDSVISKKSKELLGKYMVEMGGFQGQIAVIDAATSHLLSWNALKNEGEKMEQTPLLKRMCSSEIFLPFLAVKCLLLSNTSLEDSVDTGNGVLAVNDSLIIRDYNWQTGGYGKLTYRQALINQSRIGMYHAVMQAPVGMDYWTEATDTRKNTNAMEIAAIFNSIYHLDKLAQPTLDSAKVDEWKMNVDPMEIKYYREISVDMFNFRSAFSKGAEDDVELAGLYNVASNSAEQTFSLVCCYPIDKPKFALSIVVASKYKKEISSDMLFNMVNELIKFLKAI